MQARKAGFEIFGFDAQHIAQVGGNVAIAQACFAARRIHCPLRLHLAPRGERRRIAGPQVAPVFDLGVSWGIGLIWLIWLGQVQAKRGKRLVKLGFRIMGILRVGKVQLVTRPQARDLR